MMMMMIVVVMMITPSIGRERRGDILLLSLALPEELETRERRRRAAKRKHSDFSPARFSDETSQRATTNERCCSITTRLDYPTHYFPSTLCTSIECNYMSTTLVHLLLLMFIVTHVGMYSWRHSFISHRAYVMT